MLPHFEQLLPKVRENLNQVLNRISVASHRCGRSPQNVQLVAVTKYAPTLAVQCLMSCGQKSFGENRPQQLIKRASAALSDDIASHPQAVTNVSSSQVSDSFDWHLIGPLQSNKIRSLLPWVSMIHSVDSIKLVERISRIAGELQLHPQLLLQVNISGEESKGGFSPSQISDVWPQLTEFPNVNIVGLMTMAPLTNDEELIRSTFRGLRELRDELVNQTPEHPLPELSMGMSHDFEIAIQEGATLVRIGSLLFKDGDST